MTTTEFTLYTMGYSGMKPAEIKQLVEKTGAVLADVRISPRSRVPQWSGAALKELLGDRYVHIPEFGNKNYKGQYGDGVILKDPDGGSKRVFNLLLEKPVIMMCACKNHETCHRRNAAQMMEDMYMIHPTHLSASDIRAMIKPDTPQQMSFF